MVDTTTDAAAMMPGVPTLQIKAEVEPSEEDHGPVEVPPPPKEPLTTDRGDPANLDEEGQESVVLLEEDEGCTYSLSLSTSAGPSPGSATVLSPMSAFYGLSSGGGLSNDEMLHAFSPHTLFSGQSSHGSLSTLIMDPAFFPSSPPFLSPSPAHPFPHPPSPGAPAQPTKPRPVFTFPLSPASKPHASSPLSRLPATRPPPPFPYQPFHGNGHTPFYNPFLAPPPGSHRPLPLYPAAPIGLPPLPPLPVPRRTPSPAGGRGRYKCRHCGQLKRGHDCPHARKRNQRYHRDDDDDDEEEEEEEEDGMVETRDVGTQVDLPPRPLVAPNRLKRSKTAGGNRRAGEGKSKRAKGEGLLTQR